MAQISFWLSTTLLISCYSEAGFALSSKQLLEQDFSAPPVSEKDTLDGWHTKITNNTLTDQLPGVSSLFYREAVPPFLIPTRGHMLLLHAADHSSQTWSEEVGGARATTMHLMAASGYRVVAVDLPAIYGFPQSRSKGRSKQEPADFLLSIIEALKLDRPVLVSPAESGAFSVPFLAKYPTKMFAFVPISPCCLDEISHWTKISVPTLVVQGARDGPPPPQLLSMPNRNVLLLKDGPPHAAYITEHRVFHGGLVNFLTFVRKQQ